MSAKPQTIDEYLAPLSTEKRAALEKLRRTIRSAAPMAEECNRYRIPAFRLGGRILVAFGAAAEPERQAFLRTDRVSAPAAKRSLS
jgi:uncharacterized protein YdhG (YjbR/CyaY superfamily)